MEIKQLRKEFSKHLKKDEGLWLAYHANIAMCIYDNRRKDGRLNLEDCKVAAEKILLLMFN